MESESSKPLESLVEEYVERCRDGQPPPIEFFIQQHPELETEIRELFPTLQFLETLRELPAGSYTPATEDPREEETFNEKAFGDFRVLRQIGRGGMGVVYQAVQLSLGRVVALKVLSDQLSHDQRFQKRFQREAQAAAGLHHTNIVPVFGVGQSDGLHYYVMQYIEGDSLDRVIAHRPRAHTSADHWFQAARIAEQIADALAYAHEQGIIHRDIKPANLLLDDQGMVWIADFGLAKADDNHDLTQTGDVLGTLRYISPEQLEGRASPRSDIYSLGVTLYELLSLQPAFSPCQRGELIHRVLHQFPTPLRQVAPSVPRDLATIVHKAMEKEPAHRYQSAGEMRDDLRRFLAGDPISARRLSPFHQMARWGARHPSAAMLAVILMLIGLISPFGLGYFNHLARRARQAELRAESRLYDSLRATASAKRFSGRQGQHFDTLDSLIAARQLHRSLSLPVEEIEPMRLDAIAALALPDLRSEIEWDTHNSGNLSLAFMDETLEFCSVAVPNGISIRRFADDHEISRIPLLKSYEKARFCPGGRYLSLTHFVGGAGGVEVWDWRQAERVYHVDRPATMFASDFSSDGRYLAVGHVDSTVTIHDMQRFQQVCEFQVASPPISLGFHPEGKLIAVNCQTAYRTEVWDWNRHTLVRTMDCPSDVFGQAWSSDGRLLGVVEGFDIYIWDMTTSTEVPWRILRGHTWVVSELAFHPKGRYLFSHGWREGKTRVWDLAEGTQVLICDGYVTRASQDGTRVAYRKPDGIGLWTFAGGEACVHPVAIASTPVSVHASDFSPDGKWLAAVGNWGIDVWECQSWSHLGHTELREGYGIAFDRWEPGLLVSHQGGMSRYAFPTFGDPGALERDCNFVLPEAVLAHQLSQSRDGRRLFTDLLGNPEWTATGTAILFDRESKQTRILKGLDELRFSSMSPDGRWGATGTLHGVGVELWDLDSLSCRSRLDAGKSAGVAFSQDGKWLATAGNDKIAVWDLDTLNPAFTFPATSVIGCLTFSHSGNLLAVMTSGGMLQLMDVEKASMVATLNTNNEPGYVHQLRFSPDDRYLAMSCGTDGLRIWDLEALRIELQRLDLAWE